MRSYTHEETIEAMRLVSWKHRPFFKPGFELTTPLEHATRWTLDEPGSSRGHEAQSPSLHSQSLLTSAATHRIVGNAVAAVAKYPNPYAGKPPAQLASDTGPGDKLSGC